MDLAAFRKGLGLTQEQIAPELEVSRGAVAMFETGAARPSVETAWRYIELAEAHGIMIRLEDIFPRNGR